MYFHSRNKTIPRKIWEEIFQQINKFTESRAVDKIHD